MSRDAPNPAVLVTVVICTRNRSADLANALRSVVEQIPGTPPYEIVVVDNGSTDDTREVVGQFEHHGIVHYVHEATPGLSHARNKGWRSARGSYIAYLDDDAVPCSTWVAAIAEAFGQGDDIGVVGGRVEPVWLAPRPTWLGDQLALGLTIVDWSDTPKLLTDLDAEWVVGANMAIRADVLPNVGGFRPELGRVGTRMLSGEEVFLAKEALRLGCRCLYWPPMSVTHPVPASRLTRRWFRHRYYWQGVSDAVMQLLDERPSLWQRARAASRATLRLARRPRRLVGLLRRTDDAVQFSEQCWTLVELGRVAGLWGQAHAGADRDQTR